LRTLADEELLNDDDVK